MVGRTRRPILLVAAATAALALFVSCAAADELVQPALGLGGSLLVQLEEQSVVPLPSSVDITTACSLMRLANAASNSRTCSALGKGQSSIISGYRNKCLDTNATGVGQQQAQPPTKNLDGTTAPAPLHRRANGVPSSFVGRALTNLQAKEGGTWAFLWQLLLNQYLLNTCCAGFCGGSLTALLVPTGWSTAIAGDNGFAGVAFLQQQPPQLAADGPLPYASAFRRGDALVLVVRGTGAELEWLANYNYRLVDGPEFAVSGGTVRRIPGRVHAGFASIFAALWPKLLPAVDAAGVRRVWVTGHSQGSNVAAMVAAAASDLLAEKGVSGRGVDAVLFGTPQGGDADFVAGVAARAEVRSIAHEADVVAALPCTGASVTLAANMPACASPPALVSTLTAPRNRTYISAYERHRGVVTITAARLPAQAAAWERVKRWTKDTAEKNLLAAHVCALTCYVASNSFGFGSPDRCLYDGGTAPDADGHTSCFPPELVKLLPGASRGGGCPRGLAAKGQASARAGCGGGAGGDLPVCGADVMADTQAWIQAKTLARQDLKDVKINFQFGSVADDAPTMRQIVRVSLLPCDPNILPSAARNGGPVNVRAVLRVLPLELWNTLITPSAVGKAGGNGPAPTGFDDPAASYRTFINLVARWPFFCGERGDWPTLDDACRRSLVALFAHAAQETGRGENIGKPPWQTLFQYTREQNCYDTPDSCRKYNVNTFTELYGAPPDAVFFGRGGHQLTYVYNYASFSALVYQDFDLLVKDPDRLVRDAAGVLGSAIYFFMESQPPKPSMHDVITGAYKLRSNVGGMTADAVGAIYDRFMATHSIINGGVECSPPAGDKQAEALAYSRNRYGYYLDLLGAFNVTLDKRTAWERAYVPGTTICTIENGNVWGTYQDQIANRAYLYYFTSPDNPSGTKCRAIYYELASRPRLSLVPENQQALCERLAAA